MIINENFLKMPKNYLFSEISKRVNEFAKSKPDINLIKLGIGDVTLPLPSSVISSMEKAVAQMADISSFRGYGPEQGYLFLREKIAEIDYGKLNVFVSPDEIFVSDGSKCDCGNIVDIFSSDISVGICNPVYPVYTDSNAIAGRAGDFDSKKGQWSKINYIQCTKENNFIADASSLKNQKAPELIYLCFPNNPTGAMISYEKLKEWVDYANENGSVILYDGAYEAFITGDYPRSIYEIPNAKKCAIEFRSFSKTAGFTGLRCAYTVIPNELVRDNVKLNELWSRRQSTKFNAVSYVTQMAAFAVYTPQGQNQIKEIVNYYMENAKIVKRVMDEHNVENYGGTNAPYVWIKTPDNKSSWDFFQELLDSTGVVVTPGVGFGSNGEGYIRISAFAKREDIIEGMDRISSKLSDILKK